MKPKVQCRQPGAGVVQLSMVGSGSRIIMRNCTPTTGRQGSPFLTATPLPSAPPFPKHPHPPHTLTRSFHCCCSSDNACRCFLTFAASWCMSARAPVSAYTSSSEGGTGVSPAFIASAHVSDLDFSTSAVAACVQDRGKTSTYNLLIRMSDSKALKSRLKETDAVHGS
jgi:hypothetical protein